MANPKRLPIKIKRIPGGYRLDFGERQARLYVYSESERANPTGLQPHEAEAFAKAVARALTEAWAGEA